MTGWLERWRYTTLLVLILAITLPIAIWQRGLLGFVLVVLYFGGIFTIVWWGRRDQP